MTKALTTTAQNALATLDETTRELATRVRSVLRFEGNDTDLALYAEVCRRKALDPFANQVYAVFRGGKMTIQTGIDGYRAIAFRTGDLDAIDEPEFFDWDDPKARHARVKVWRKGSSRPTVGIAYWTEYSAQSGLWGKMPRTMLAKCAEAQALRKAFPEALSGLYTAEEMSQADGPRHAPEPVVEAIALDLGPTVSPAWRENADLDPEIVRVREGEIVTNPDVLPASPEVIAEIEKTLAELADLGYGAKANVASVCAKNGVGSLADLSLRRAQEIANQLLDLWLAKKGLKTLKELGEEEAASLAAPELSAVA